MDPCQKGVSLFWKFSVCGDGRRVGSVLFSPVQFKGGDLCCSVQLVDTVHFCLYDKMMSPLGPVVVFQDRQLHVKTDVTSLRAV